MARPQDIKTTTPQTVTGGQSGVVIDGSTIDPNTNLPIGTQVLGPINLDSDLTVDANIHANFIFGTILANVSNSAYANIAGVANTVSGNVQANINQVGPLISLDVVNDVSVTGNVIATYFVGNGSQLTGIVANSEFSQTANYVVQANQPNITSLGSLTSLNVGGTVDSSLVPGNLDHQLGNTTSHWGGAYIDNVYTGTQSITSNVDGIILSGNTYGTFVGNMSGTAQTAVTVTANSQPNITGLGTLGSLSVNGNINSSGNVVAAYFYGDGSNITNITVPVANFSNYSGVANIANISYSVDLANVVGIGNIASINLDGNVSNILHGDGSWGPERQDANANYANYAGSAFSVDGANVSGTVNSASFANIANTANSVAGANVVGTVANANYATYAATAYNVTGSNVTGPVNEALVANISNISYSVSASNITGAFNNITAVGNVTANYFIGNGSQLTGLNVPSGNSINNGDSNVTIPTANGPIFFNVPGPNADVSSNISFTTQAGGGQLYIISNAPAGASATFVSESFKNTASDNSIALRKSRGTPTNPASLQPNDNTGLVLFEAMPGSTLSFNQTQVAGIRGRVDNSYVAGQQIVPQNVQIFTTANVGNVTTYRVNWFYSNGTFAPAGNIVSLSSADHSLGNSVTSNYFIGNASYLTSIPAGNISGQVANALVADTVTNSTQPNITSVGTLSGLNVNGNVGITGNLTVIGNVNYNNVTDLVVGDPLIFIGSNNTGNLYDLGLVAQYDDTSLKYTGLARNHNNGTWTFFDSLTTPPTVTNINWAGTTNANVILGNLTASGNVSASYFIGNGSQLTGLPAGYSNTDVANYLASGNVTTNIITTANVSANYYIGNGALLTNINAANVVGNLPVRFEVKNVSGGTLTKGTPIYISGSVGASGVVEVQASRADTASTMGCVGLLEQDLTTNAFGTALSIGQLTNINTIAYNVGDTIYVAPTGGITNVRPVDGYVVQPIGTVSRSNASTGIYEVNIWDILDLPNLNQGNIWVGTVGNGSPVQTPLSTANVGNATFATTAGSATTAGTVTTNAQPNITSVGTLTSLSVSGNIDVGNLNLTGNIVDNGALSIITGSNGNINLRPNGTGIVIANSAVSAIGNITAPFFIGNGSLLTGISGGGGSSISNGNSSVNIATANGNITATVGAAANVFVITSAGANVIGTISSSGNATFPNVSVTTAVITTGNITTINSGKLQNGNSNVTVNTNANISFYTAGNANARFNISSTGANVLGDFLVTSGNITGVFANGFSNVSIPAANGNVLITSNSITGITVTPTTVVVGNGIGGNISNVNAISANSMSATITMQVPNYTIAGKPGSGAIGQMIALSDATPGGRLAFWDTTNSRWSYVNDNSAV